MFATIRLALCLSLAGLPSAASAEETLNKAELTALVSGNTVHFRDLSNGPHGRAYTPREKSSSTATTARPSRESGACGRTARTA